MPDAARLNALDADRDGEPDVQPVAELETVDRGKFGDLGDAEALRRGEIEATGVSAYGREPPRNDLQRGADEANAHSGRTGADDIIDIEEQKDEARYGGIDAGVGGDVGIRGGGGAGRDRITPLPGTQSVDEARAERQAEEGKTPPGFRADVPTQEAMKTGIVAHMSGAVRPGDDLEAEAQEAADEARAERERRIEAEMGGTSPRSGVEDLDEEDAEEGHDPTRREAA
jgi:hypothetical protein